MNAPAKERAAEILAAAAIVALLSAAIGLGALFLDRMESDRVSRQLASMAAGSLAPAGTAPAVEAVTGRAPPPVLRAFRFKTREGRLLGLGAAVFLDGPDWGAELLVLTDERGRVRASAVRTGSSGIRAEELAEYLRQREKGASGGVGPAADVRGMEYAVRTAFEAVAAFARQGGTP